MDREELINRAWLLYRQLWDFGMQSDAEDIMLEHNAAEDDSDRKEGFFATMSDKDILESIYDLQARIDLAFEENIDTYELELNRAQYNLLLSVLDDALTGRFRKSAESIQAIIDQLK